MTGRSGARGPTGWAALLAVVLIAVPLAATEPSSAAQAAGAAVTWKIVPSPTPSGGTFSSGTLNAVTCTRATSCLAVGTGSASGSSKPLAERWNGTAWSIVKSDNPGTSGGTLTGVSCGSANSCFAVGQINGGATLIEHWDGTRFVSIGATTPGWLSSVSCVSATMCFAVGGRVSPRVTLLERWDGTKWSLVTDPAASANGRFNAVSCVTATSCLAIGTSAVRWDGKHWSPVANPDPKKFYAASLGALSCTSATSCMATHGNYSSVESLTHAARWNGSRWSSVVTPIPKSFLGIIIYGLTCASATNCVAVGVRESTTAGGDAKFSGTLIEQWNGTRWAAIGSPNPSGLGVLRGVWCADATHCVAVGTGGRSLTLVERLGQ